MLLFFNLFFLGFASAESAIDLPAEVIKALREEYSKTSTLEMKPVKEDLTITVRSGKNTQTIKRGLTNDRLDLSSYVDIKAESFEASFEAPFPLDANTRMFFINRYKPLQEAGVKGLLPCAKALKIQSNLDKFFTTRGIKLMTKDGRYLNVLGGDILLTHLEGQRLRIVFLKITDSRYANRLCTAGS